MSSELYRKGVKLHEEGTKVFRKYNNYTAKDNLAPALRFLQKEANQLLAARKDELEKSRVTRDRLNYVSQTAEFYLQQINKGLAA